MKYFKKMIGERLYLSPMCSEDAETYAAWLNDLEVAKYLMIPSLMISLEAEQEFISKFQKEPHFAIVLKDGDRLIGNCGIIDIDNVHRRAEVGIFIGDRAAWGQGYGTEALGLLIDYAFNLLNLRNLMLRVYAPNARAIGCYKKLGFQEMGLRRQSHFFGGRYVDELYMDLLAEEFIRPSVIPQI